ncbi:MAG: epoxide hydrolase, partial [Betaproteobacteria bacterium]|nr:epoxide hydrolase [Betaproteobacteria bacterium]
MINKQLIPFTLSVPDEVLDDLKQRLNNTRWPDEIPKNNWTYGA